jgi:hypothetical protein
MRTKRKLLAGILVTLIVLIVFAVSSRALLRPPMPEPWQNLRTGMTHEEILKLIPDEHADLRSLKGFESFTHKTTMLGGEACWQLLVSYNSTGGLTHTEVGFVHRDWSFLNSSRRDILSGMDHAKVD